MPKPGLWCSWTKWAAEQIPCRVPHLRNPSSRYLFRFVNGSGELDVRTATGGAVLPQTEPCCGAQISSKHIQYCLIAFTKPVLLQGRGYVPSSCRLPCRCPIVTDAVDYSELCGCVFENVIYCCPRFTKSQTCPDKNSLGVPRRINARNDIYTRTTV